MSKLFFLKVSTAPTSQQNGCPIPVPVKIKQNDHHYPDLNKNFCFVMWFIDYFIYDNNIILKIILLLKLD
jgi:hypothetical protein